MATSTEARADSRCPICSGTGFQVVEDAASGRSFARTCACRRARRPQDLLRLARIPKRYAGCDFESFYPLPGNRSLEEARAKTRAFVDGYTLRKARDDGEFGLLFIGPPGVGKTHLAVSALRALILEQGVAGHFSDFRDLVKELRDSYDPVSETTELEVLRPLLQAEVLVLDDLGAAKMTEWARDMVGHIVSTRYNERKVTLITTNLPDEPSERDAERPTLTGRVGPAVRSRLYEMCVLIRLEGEDFRRKIRGEGRDALRRQ